ncbi:alpha/beta hydrolase family protein [Gordonia sp. NPDC003425]
MTIADQHGPGRRRRLAGLALASLAAATIGLAGSAGIAHADDTTPGRVISTAPLAPRATLPGSVDGQRITYWTKGVKDVPAQSSAAVYLPPGKAPAGGWPVIAWAHGTTGLNDVCAYSTNGPILPDRDWAYLDSWLQQGYAVVASDYVGLGTPGPHPYLDGKVEAHSVVDAVKAATATNPALAKKWVVVGQSQGGGAAMFTARYADEFGGNSDGLSYRGGVATGVPAYVEDLVPLIARPGSVPVSLGKSLPETTSYVLYILSGLRAAFPEWNVDSYLTPYGREWVDRAEGPLCDTTKGPGQEYGFGDVIEKSDVVIGKLFSRPLDQIPGFSAALKDYMGVPESGYHEPVFVGQGLLDTDVNTPGTLLLVQRMKGNGQPVTFKAYNTDHSGTVNASKADSIPFVKRLFG